MDFSGADLVSGIRNVGIGSDRRRMNFFLEVKLLSCDCKTIDTVL